MLLLHILENVSTVEVTFDYESHILPGAVIDINIWGTLPHHQIGAPSSEEEGSSLCRLDWGAS